MTCSCGNTMCYICRLTITTGYHHFCDCLRPSSEPGKPCQICNKCSLGEASLEDNEALDAKEEALKEYAEKEPKLLDLEIGPPLKKTRLQPEFNELLEFYGVGIFDQYGSNMTGLWFNPRRWL